MSRSLIILLILSALTVQVPARSVGSDTGRTLVAVGRVEPIDGELDVSAQMSGTLVAVLVKEGDWVTKGAVLAEVDARREKAALDLALAKLARVKAGVGKEEIAVGEAAKDAVAAELAFAESEYQRATSLRDQGIVTDDVLDGRRARAETLRKQLVGTDNQYQALKRGPLLEDVALAEAEVTMARVSYDLRVVRAPSDGAALSLNKHAGDYLSLLFPSPILRMANTRRLRVRLEINEQEVYSVRKGMIGEFSTFGASKANGRLRVTTVLSAFAPRRLFEPDSTARMDTRTLQVLCDIQEGSQNIYSGQRVTASFSLAGL